MSHYDNPLTITHVISGVDFGAGNSSHGIAGPVGATGVLREVLLSATETFNAVTTAATIAVGTQADVDKYLNESSIGTLAATEGLAIPDTGYLIRDLPADTLVEVTCVAPTGGTPAGIADVMVVIDWSRANPRMNNS